MTTKQPRLTDNDHGEIAVDLEGKQLRGWSYSNDDERRQKMAQAREYVEAGAMAASTGRLDSICAACISDMSFTRNWLRSMA